MIDIQELNISLGNTEMKSSSAITEENFDFDLPVREARENLEKTYLLYQLNKAGVSVSKVSNFVDVERTNLYRKLKTLGIDLK